MGSDFLVLAGGLATAAALTLLAARRRGSAAVVAQVGANLLLLALNRRLGVGPAT